MKVKDSEGLFNKRWVAGNVETTVVASGMFKQLGLIV
jgi:hypothetical protein